MKFLKNAVVFIMTFIIIAGCGNASRSNQTAAPVGSSGKAPITFNMIMGQWQVWDEPMTADPVGQWIIEQTGVTVDVELVSGDLAEKYSLLLATGDYPDFMMYDNLPMRKYIDEGALLAYDDYLDRLPNVVSKYGEWDLNSMRDLSDGKLYKLHQWYMGDYVVILVGMNIRYDLMVDRFGQSAKEKHIFKTSEIVDFFSDYKQVNPVTADGNEVFPLTGTFGNLVLICRQYFGLTAYVEVDDSNVIPDYMDPNYWDMMKWLNNLYREGILDPEFAINNRDTVNIKATNGTSIAVPCHEEAVTQPNGALIEALGPDAFLMCYYRIVDEGHKETPMAMSSLGSGGLTVTKNCKDVDRAMEFIDFMNEPLTSFILCNGYEGGIWEFDANGKINILTDKIRAIPVLWDRFREYGGYKYIWMLNEGVDKRFSAYDGLLWQPIHDGYGEVKRENFGRMTFWEPSELINTALFNNLSPDAGTDEAIIQQSLIDITNRTLPTVIMASSEAEAQKIYDAMLETVKMEGVDKFLAYVSSIYFKQKSIILGK